MTDSNLDIYSSSRRFEKRRERMKRSPREYAKSREKVKDNVREVDEHMEKNEKTAEVMLYIEMNEDKIKEKMLKESLRSSIGEFSSYDKKQWGQMQLAFSQGKFDLSVDTTHDNKPRISMQIALPEGKVSEKLPLTQSLQEDLMAQALKSAGRNSKH